MAKREQKLKPLQADEITLFDGMMTLINDMPSEEKQRLARTFLLLMACAEDHRLNMNKLAQLLTQLSDGQFNFRVEEKG